MATNRQSYAPMEFEYDNLTGPISEDSPWRNAPPAKKRKLNDFSSASYASNSAHENGLALTAAPIRGDPGTHSVLDSPSKSAFSTPNRPQLNAPAGQSYFFQQSQNTISPIPSRFQSSKWEPRTPHNEVDFSSGGETPNTPAQDSDAATPDTQLANRMGSLSHGLEKKSPRKSKRQSLIQFFSGSPSPAKEEPRKPYSRKAENRIMKRRAKKSKNTLREEEEDSGEEQSALKDLPAPPPPGFVASIPGVLSWVEAHPNLPAVLSYYMQFVVNAVLGVSFLWIIYLAYSAVMNDIDREAASAARQILHDISVCSHEYKQNHCGHARVPALEQPCNQWQLCMQQDAYKIARASVGARTFAMIFNAFVEEFSYKAMVFITFLFIGLHYLRRTVIYRVRDLQDWSIARQQMAAQTAAQQHMPMSQFQQYPHPSSHLLPRQECIERTGFADQALFG